MRGEVAVQMKNLSAQSVSPATDGPRSASMRRPRQHPLAEIMTGIDFADEDLTSWLYLSVEAEVRSGWRPDGFDAHDWLAEAIRERTARDEGAPEPMTVDWAAGAIREKRERESAAMATLTARLQAIVDGLERYGLIEKSAHPASDLCAALLSEAVSVDTL